MTMNNSPTPRSSTTLYSSIYDKTNSLVQQELSKRYVNLNKLEKTIQKENLPMRVGDGFSVRHYFAQLVNEGFLREITPGVYLHTTPERNPLLGFRPIPELDLEKRVN